MPDHHIPLYPECSYHVFNRAIGNEKLFRSEENYRFFLANLAKHILPVAGIFTYSLLPNHFHLLIRTRDEKQLIAHFERKKKKEFDQNIYSLPEFIMEQFSNWFNSYTKAFNKRYGRKGALFMDYTKRSIVENDSDFASFVFYIHKNAVHHGLCNRIGEWKHDGYKSLLSERPTHLLRSEVISWFGSKELFMKFHDQPVELKQVDFKLNL